MIKKIILMSLVLSQLVVSCSSDDSNDETTTPEKELTLEEEIANIVKQPYSDLTPAQQKVKLEVEANSMLTELDKTKSSSAIEAIQNLGRLFSLKHIDLFDGKSDNGVEEVLNISGVYGIYTWNDAQKIWIKTASTTELKFVFPAKASQTTNNAVLTSKSTSSDVKFKNIDTYEEWVYDPIKGEGSYTDAVYDWFYLPTSTDAVLTIDNAQVGTFAQTATYSNGKQVPNEFAYKMVLSDGYTWEMSGTKATQNNSKASLTYNGKNLVNFIASSNAEVDKLLEKDKLDQYRGKANGLFTLMDNFVIVADMDLAAEAADKVALYTNNVRPTQPSYENANSDFKSYYTALNAYEKKISEGNAANFNKNMKLILVSKKDGTKIADLVQHSEEVGDPYTFYLPVWDAENGYWGIWENNNGGSFSQPYLEEVVYLKFNDQTQVEMGAYFSEGFADLQGKFTDFISAFKKQE